MDTASVNMLADLMIDLDRAGVRELVADDGRLLYRPRSAVTPELAERLRSHKAALLAALRPAGAPGPEDEAAALLAGLPMAEAPPLGPDGWPTDSIDPPEPCSDCGGLMFWWNAFGDQRCLACDPPARVDRYLRRSVSVH